MLRLPLLESHRTELEKCVYCPKLSRAACPISNVEANESVTPWGKMSMAYFAGRGDVPTDATHAETAWACSTCFACRERCDHKNDVAATLLDARAEYFVRDAAPAAAMKTAARFPARTTQDAEAIARIEASIGAPRGDRVRVLVGCGYARHAEPEARDALIATASLAGEPVRALRSCCGLPLLHAGDRPGFLEAARRLTSEIAGAERLVVVDPGCARALLVDYPRIAASIHPRPELFLDLAFASIARLRSDKVAPLYRYHDPCQLGRGLGRFDPPRAILARLAGQAPAEFQRRREHGECSGAGGLLPATRPETSRAMAEARVEEHRRGGGVLVTHCAQSLRRFRSRGEPAVDLLSLIARALGP
jgi:Fe-S oxidoreductase